MVLKVVLRPDQPTGRRCCRSLEDGFILKHVRLGMHCGSFFQLPFRKLETFLLLRLSEMRLGWLFLVFFSALSARCRIVHVLTSVSSSNNFLLTLRSDPTAGSSRSSTIRSSSALFFFRQIHFETPIGGICRDVMRSLLAKSQRSIVHGSEFQRRF